MGARIYGLLGVVALSSGCWLSHSHEDAMSDGGARASDASGYADGAPRDAGALVDAGPRDAEADVDAGSDRRYQGLSAGGAHTCAVDADNGVWCWGANGSRQVADSPEGRIDSPNRYAGLEARAIAAGDAHTCAVSAVGAVSCWGGNALVATGAPWSVELSSSPNSIPGLGSVSRVDAGKSHACAIASETSVLCWGGGLFRAEEMDLGFDVIDIQSGGPVVGAADCALSTSGLAACWTIERADDTEYHMTEPIVVMHDAVAVATGGVVGGYYNCATDRDGSTWCWNCEGGSCDAPTLRFDGHRFEQISIGMGHACGLDPDGSVWCWGRNNSGQLGTGDTEPAAVPSRLAALPPVQTVSVGADHSCALDLAGRVYCWGSNRMGAVGIPGARTVLTPQRIR